MFIAGLQIDRFLFKFKFEFEFSLASRSSSSSSRNKFFPINFFNELEQFCSSSSPKKFFSSLSLAERPEFFEFDFTSLVHWQTKIKGSIHEKKLNDVGE